jgi:hypothetical protein
MTTKRILDPAETELVFNLWGIADIDTGIVHGLAGRAYRLDGTDEEKLKVLHRLSFTDFHLAIRYVVPERFKISNNGETLNGLTTVNMVFDQNSDLFEVVFQGLESRFPTLLVPQTEDSQMDDLKQVVPQDPLSVRTILFMDESGYLCTMLPAEPGTSHIEETIDELYILNNRDRRILDSTGILLMKILQWPLINSKQAEAVSNVIQFLDGAPSEDDETDICINLTGPRRKFGEHEIFHFWEVAIKEMMILISSGGYFYRKSTGGDSFTCMSWSAEPGYEAHLDEYWQNHHIVDDAMAFEPEVAQIDMKESKYSLSVTVNGDEIDVENIEDDL